MSKSFATVAERAVTPRGTLSRSSPAEDIAGGSVYDALVALAAEGIGATVVTLDRQARFTCAAIGVEVASPQAFA